MTSSEQIKQSGCDIMLWADGTMCYRQELSQMSHMSDDFEVISVDTARWQELHKED
jgi:hypothetical protein